MICGAKIKYVAQKYNKKAFEKLQITRFLDDWAYQANVRQNLKTPDIKEVSLLMKSFENEVYTKLGTSANIKYSFPWKRLFEVEVEFH